jgi:Kef-type K+ transport system membrane component KefB
MYTTGLETDLKELKKTGVASLLIAVLATLCACRRLFIAGVFFRAGLKT